MGEAEERPEAEEAIGSAGYEIFIGLLSLLSVVNLVLMPLIDDEDLTKVLGIMNALLSVIFLGDFAYRMSTAPSRSTYFLRQYGWADLLASMPLAQLKILRLIRLMRVYRVMRIGGVRHIVRTLLRDRAGSALLTMLLLGILMLEFGSLFILYLEKNVDGANITTASDAIWYVVVTMSTVGYGDRFPVGNSGRVFGAFIIVIGVGIFGTFTGYLANLFLAPKKPIEVPAEGDVASARIAELRELVARQQAALDELERQLPERGTA